MEIQSRALTRRQVALDRSTENSDNQHAGKEAKTPTWEASESRVVQLIELPPEAFHALAAGDLAAANRSSPVELTADCLAPEWRSLWRRRSAQIEADPAVAGWITCVIFDPVIGKSVGRAGYHGPPDDAGMVEVGYSVDPDYRRRGYARAALVALLDRARREPSVHTVRASIRPDNAASRALVAQYGFVEVGEQWDDEDGLETIFEVDVNLRR